MAQTELQIMERIHALDSRTKVLIIQFLVLMEKAQRENPDYDWESSMARFFEQLRNEQKEATT